MKSEKNVKYVFSNTGRQLALLQLLMHSFLAVEHTADSCSEISTLCCCCTGWHHAFSVSFLF